MLISDSNIMFTKEADLKAICAPLFKNTHYRYFGYFRYYKDSHIVGFSTNSELNKLFFSYELYPSIQELSEVMTHIVVLSYDNFHHLPPLEIRNNQQLELNMCLAKAHHLYHRIYFVDNKKEYFEIHGFGLPKIKCNLKDYLRITTDILHKFIIYFHAKFINVISRCDSNRIVLSNRPSSSKKTVRSKQIRDKINFNKFDKLFETRHFCLKGILVKKREMQCLESLTKGKSAKQIAIELNISYRTVESYLESLKSKLGCNYRSELIKIFYDEVLSSSFMFNKHVDYDTSLL
jgi:LuxR family transcriptional regulator, quorum-sensing system regulator SolR